MEKLHTVLFAITSPDLGPLKDNGASAGQSQINTAVNVAFGIAGSLALLFIIIGGLRYIMSEGDPQKAAQAKGAIIYALVGLVITLTAFGIVRFVVGKL
jgi:hypothetical protein